MTRRIYAFPTLRISPNVHATLAEVDLFADRVVHAMKRGMAWMSS